VSHSASRSSRHLQSSNRCTSKKVKKKTAAWISLGVGAAFVLTGAAIPKNETEGAVFPSENEYVRAAFYLVGSVSILASIPYFIGSGINKKKAASLSVSILRSPEVTKNGLLYTPMPAVSLRTNL
jgi:hypothetical protein